MNIKIISLIFLIIVSLIIVSLIVFFLYNLYYTEKFTMILNLSGLVYKRQPVISNRIINTPLKNLRSNMKIFGEYNIPTFFCYNMKMLSPVQDQGSNCGSCWAFVISSFLSDKIIIESGYNILLSAQQLLQCYTDETGNLAQCGGAAPEDVFLWMIKTGFILTLDRDIPYKQITSNQVKESCPIIKEGVSIKPNSVNKITENINNSLIIEKNIINMKKELVYNGPIFATILVYDDFVKWRENFISGPYNQNTKSKELGGHAIEIVGYCDKDIDNRSKYKNGYWICKNSWGTKWPQGNPIYPGYFTIEMGKNVCGIESRCGVVEPDIDIIKLEKSYNKNISFTDIGLYAQTFIY